MPIDLTDGKSTLVQVMAWCRQATSHYLSQCWHRSMSPYGITRPQWVLIFLHQQPWSVNWPLITWLLVWSIKSQFYGARSNTTDTLALAKETWYTRLYINSWNAIEGIGLDCICFTTTNVLSPSSPWGDHIYITAAKLWWDKYVKLIGVLVMPYGIMDLFPSATPFTNMD